MAQGLLVHNTPVLKGPFNQTLPSTLHGKDFLPVDIFDHAMTSFKDGKSSNFRNKGSSFWRGYINVNFGEVSEQNAYLLTRRNLIPGLR